MLYLPLFIIFTIILQEIDDAKSYKQKSHLQDCNCNEKESQEKYITSLKSSACSFKTKRPLIDASKMYASSDKCNFTLVAPKMVINPYKERIQNSVQEKPFNSFYLKCAACIAVAEEISQTINRTLEKVESSNKKQEFVNDELSEKLQNLCQKGFKNYDLRRFNDITLVTNRLKCTEHINSKMDGSWTKILRELCNLYTFHMDMMHISNNYKNNTHKLSADLCSGSGIFRDCHNLDSGEFLENIKVLQCCDICDCE